MSIMQPFIGTLSLGNNPLQISGAGGWYDASLGNAAEFNNPVANGDKITQWLDLTGNNHNANKSGTNTTKPTWQSNQQNGKGTLLFTAANSQYMNVNPLTWAQSLPGFTIYTVAKPTTLDATVRTITTTDTNGFHIAWTGTYWRVGGASGLGEAQSLAGDTTKYHIFGGVFDGSQVGNANRLKFRYDGVQQTLNFGATTVGAATSGTATTLYFGTNSTTNAFYNGYIGEILVWTRTLSTVECIQVESYLKSKWAL